MADDDEQTYLAHNENRDGDQVTGQYSYVDANGALVTVTYQAGPGGYTEERNIQDGFVQIRARPQRPVQPAAPVVVQPVRVPAPAPRPAPRPTAAPRPVQVVASNDDSDLVARIIAQLTPFIRDTVSSSLQSGQQASAPAAPAQPVPVARAIAVAPAPAPAPIAPVAQASSVEGVFGTAGANNVQVNTPDFNFAYDLRK